MGRDIHIVVEGLLRHPDGTEQWVGVLHSDYTLEPDVPSVGVSMYRNYRFFDLLADWRADDMQGERGPRYQRYAQETDIYDRVDLSPLGRMFLRGQGRYGIVSMDDFCAAWFSAMDREPQGRPIDTLFRFSSSIPFRAYRIIFNIE